VSAPRIRGSHLGGSPDLPPLVVGPSLGTSVAALWSGAARRLAGVYHVIGWDLPGHGVSPRPKDAFTIDDLAASVIKIVEDKIGRRPFTYAGVSVAGAVGLQLLLGHPERIVSAALICTAARIGDPDDWQSRAQVVRSAGTGEVVALSIRRWFAPGFFERDPASAQALLDTLRRVDDDGYARTCEALAEFDASRCAGEYGYDNERECWCATDGDRRYRFVVEPIALLGQRPSVDRDGFVGLGLSANTGGTDRR